MLFSSNAFYLYAMIRNNGRGNGRGQVRRRSSYGIVYQFRVALHESGIKFSGTKVRRFQYLKVKRFGGLDTIETDIEQGTS